MTFFILSERQNFHLSIKEPAALPVVFGPILLSHGREEHVLRILFFFHDFGFWTCIRNVMLDSLSIVCLNWTLFYVYLPLLNVMLITEISLR